MSRVAFMLREALVNLRRNILVVTGAVLAVFICWVAFALAVNELVRINTIAWQQGVHLIVWLTTPAARCPRDATRTPQRGPHLGRGRQRYYVDKTAAYEEFLDLFGDNPEMVEASRTRRPCRRPSASSWPTSSCTSRWSSVSSSTRS